MQLTPKMSIRGGAAGPPVKGLRSGGARPSVVCEEQLRQYLEAAPVLRRRFPYRAGLMSMVTMDQLIPSAKHASVSGNGQLQGGKGNLFS
jgi:hypothetical protein